MPGRRDIHGRTDRKNAPTIMAAVCLALLEQRILAAAVTTSGRRIALRVIDENDGMVYETDGSSANREPPLSFGCSPSGEKRDSNSRASES